MCHGGFILTVLGASERQEQYCRSKCVKVCVGWLACSMVLSRVPEAAEAAKKLLTESRQEALFS